MCLPGVSDWQSKLKWKEQVWEKGTQTGNRLSFGQICSQQFTDTASKTLPASCVLIVLEDLLCGHLFLDFMCATDEAMCPRLYNQNHRL